MLTRYLYRKKDVEKALVVELLCPSSVDVGVVVAAKKEPALFWAYELYYSGFIGNLIELLWRIYYDFYVVVYPCLEPCFTEYLQSVEYLRDNPKVVGIVIRNLLHKRPTLDVFLFMRGYIDPAGIGEFTRCIIAISSADLSNHGELDKVVSMIARYVMVADEYIDAFKKAVSDNPLLSILGMKRVLISTCASYKYMKLCEDDSDGDDTQVILKVFKNIQQYETVECERGYSVLKMAHARYCEDLQKVNKDCLGFIYDGMDVVGGDEDATINWTPYWQSKIRTYGGQITAMGHIIWRDNNAQEAFELECDYDIEEQPVEIKQFRGTLLVRSSPWSLLEMQHFMDMYYERWGGSDPILHRIIPMTSVTLTKRALLEFMPINSSPKEYALKRKVVEILAENQKEYLYGWYMQVMDRFEFTEESLAEINYPKLRSFVRKALYVPPKPPKQNPVLVKAAS